MNDINKIEEFLILMKLIATENNLDKKIVYTNLTYHSNNKENIEELFLEWIKEFQDEKDIKVYVPDKWRTFCQFKSKQNDNTENNKIKLYIAIDKEHINESVKRIFHYLAKIKAIHISKVANRIRYDNIVIRVNNIKSAQLISKFISKDKYIKSGIIDTNPFAFHDKFISYTWDGGLSYNMIVATYIADYINTLKHNNKLHQVSYKDFISYLKDIYQEVFINGNNVDLYKEMMDIEDYNISTEEVKEKLLNHKFITQIILKALMPDKKINEFYDELEKIISYQNNLDNHTYNIFHNTHHIHR